MYDFHGDDQAYIAFLECQLASVQWAGFVDFTAASGEQTVQGTPSTNSIQFVQYTPEGSRARSVKSERGDLPWKRQLDGFISALPTEKTWGEARKKAGIDTPVKNQLAVRLMLGHTNHTTFRSVRKTSTISGAITSQDHDLVWRGYQYAQFIDRCAGDLSFKTSVVSFQNLIFVSYCAVLMQVGVPKEKTNKMMRRYIDRNNDDSTLEGYRRGVVWINRCIAALLANGWGHKSWEIFLLGESSVPAVTNTNQVRFREAVIGAVRPLRSLRRAKLRAIGTAAAKSQHSIAGRWLDTILYSLYRAVPSGQQY